MDTKDLQKILEKMDEKADLNHKDITKKISSIDTTLIKQSKDLEYHIKRTDLLDEEVRGVKVVTRQTQDHVTKVEFFFKAVKWVGIPVILTAIGVVIKIYAG